MVEFNSDIPNNQGLPKLDKDYWKSQQGIQKNKNLFDNLVELNVGNLKGISLFSPDLKNK